MNSKYLIIGGGVASVAAAKGIRAHDKESPIVLLTSNELMPYDRPPLSKGFLSHPDMTHDDISSKYDVWYTDNRVDVRLNTTASKIDRPNRKVSTNQGDFEYEILLLATGSRPKTLPGHDALTLRTYEDGVALRSVIEASRSGIIVGSGFLGPEVAAQCVGLGKDATIVANGPHIWDRFAGPELGDFLNEYYRSHGVKVLTGEKVVAANAGDVTTASGRELKADFVLVAAGVDLNTELAEGAGLSLAEDRAVKVDQYLRSEDPNIYVAGDISHFPDPVLDKPVHHEHHLNAQWQGEVAGANMAGANQPYRKVPYFFSDFLDLHMILRGAIAKPSRTRLVGSYESAEFIELYGGADGALKMGIAISREESKLDPVSDRLEALIEEGAPLDVDVEI